MRVLVGCEESGIVTKAFRDSGHAAYSNDVIDGRIPEFHLKMDVFEAMEYKVWDIIILHPPCTALSLSGNRWYGKGMPREGEREKAITWTKNLWQRAKERARIGCALENPTSVIWQHIGVPQYIQPWQFGHGEQKKTGILTNNLPPLRPTNIVDGREQRVWKMPPSKTRVRDRSETYQGIADAMAKQWGQQ